MKKFFIIAITFLLIMSLYSCKKQEERMPFGAEKIDYDKVEGINKNGPIPDPEHHENLPPMADKMPIIERGPERMVPPDIKIEPTADLEEYPDYGGIPVVAENK